MTPQEFKQSVHDEYKRAMASSNAWVSFSDNADRMFNDVNIYGADAGRDFIESNINDIYRYITQAAKSRKAELSVQTYKFGNAALRGMADAMSELTDMEVNLKGRSITVVWAKNAIDLV